jgi:transposase
MVGGMSYKEAAENIGVGKWTVGGYIKTAKRKLKDVDLFQKAWGEYRGAA